MEPENTPTPHDITSAEKVVADHERIWLQNAVDGEASGEGRMWCQDKVWPVDENDGEPTEYVRADIHAAALALVESQRATIESLRRTVQMEAEGAQRWMDECAAAEARVTALEAALQRLVYARALSGVREIVAGWNGEGRPDGPYPRHDNRLGAQLPKTNCGAVYELDEAMTAARQALSRSGTEVKNDER